MKVLSCISKQEDKCNNKNMKSSSGIFIEKNNYKIREISKDLQNAFYPDVLDLVIWKIGIEGNQPPCWL